MSEFTDGATTPQVTDGQTDDQTPTEEPKSYLAEMVGDGKRFKTVEEAAEALAKKAVNADKHIETILAEKKELESKYQEVSTKSRSIEEILAALKAKEETEHSSADPPAKAPTVDEVLAAFEQKTQEKQKQAAREAAIKAAWEGLADKDVFGSMENAKLAVTQYLKENPARKAVVDAMAIADPKGLVTLLKQQQKSVTFAEDQESISGLTADSVGKLTWDLVKQIRKDNPKLYQSKAFQRRMHNEL